MQPGGREINLKLTISFLLPAAFMLLLVGCGGESQIADIQTPEAKVVAKVEVEPSPTKEPPKLEPTNPPTLTEMAPSATPTQLPTATVTPVPPTPIPTATPSATPTPTPTWLPMSVEWERVTLHLKDDARLVGYRDDQLPVTWVYHLFVITNPNDHMGDIRFFLRGVDEQGIEFDDDRYRVFVTSKVAAKSTAVIPTWNRIVAADNPPHDWVVDTEELEECREFYKPRGEEDKCSVLVRTINGVTSGGGIWPAGGNRTPIEDPMQNDLFTLDSDWVVNKTNTALELSYVCAYGAPLETLYQTLGVGKIPEHLRPSFQEFPEITHTRIAYGKMFVLKSEAKVQQTSLSDDGQCGYWKVEPVNAR